MQESAVFSHVPLMHFLSVRFLKSYFSKELVITDLEIKLYTKLSAHRLSKPETLLELIESALGIKSQQTQSIYQIECAVEDSSSFDEDVP